MTLFQGALFLIALGLIGFVVVQMFYSRVRQRVVLPSRRPLCFAHRGFSSQHPENTIPAFRAAFDAGVDGIELDVTLSADGQVVVRHDFDLERTTDGVGYVWEHTYDSLKKFNAAHYFGGNYPFEGIPLLTDVLDILPPSTIINIELKSFKNRSYGIERKVVQLVRQYGIENRTIISSFNPFWLLKIRLLAPELSIAFIWWNEDVPLLLKRPHFVTILRPEMFHPAAHLITPAMVGEAHRRGMIVSAWTVNNLPMIQHLHEIGVDGIITDNPEIVSKFRESVE